MVVGSNPSAAISLSHPAVDQRPMMIQKQRPQFINGIRYPCLPRGTRTRNGVCRISRERQTYLWRRHLIFTGTAIAVEKEWFADRERIILGALLLDRTDEDWVYLVLGRDELGTFRWIDGESSIRNRDQGRQRLLTTMQRILGSGQKVFPQG